MAGRRGRRRSAHGFTLIEAVIALVIFGIISVTLAMSLAIALRAQSAATERQQENGAVRVIFDALTRDVSCAYGSLNNPASLFVSSGGQSGGAASSGANLLTLTTLTHRIQLDPSGTTGSPAVGLGASLGVQGASAPPQSDCALVSYNLDTTTGTLTRMESPIPNLQAAAAPSTSPANILADRVLALDLQFWDTNAQSWRSDWDFEQQNQAQSQSNPMAAGAGGAAGATGSGATTPGSGTGDSVLPAAVQVTLVLQKSDGMPVTYTTLIPVTAQQPQPAGTGAATTSAGGANGAANTGP
jgi:prepilin-type N-terminal cleavage/methylation domain-containing protein